MKGGIDAPVRLAMGKAAAQTVEARFHLRRRVAEIEELYAGLLGKGKAGSDAHSG